MSELSEVAAQVGRKLAVRSRAGWDVLRHLLAASRLASFGAIFGLFMVVTILRWRFDRAGESVALLYVLPIALGALRFGRRGGILAAGCGFTAFTVLEAIRARGDVDMTGWLGPLLAMALIGGLVGHLREAASLREEDRKLEARRIQQLCDAQLEAARVSDSIVQQVAAARWMIEAGQSQEALAALRDAVAQGIAHASQSSEELLTS
jgi:hypothetical protein